MATTPNHGYDVPAKGTANWHKPLNRNFKRFEVDIELRDTGGNRSNYTPTNGAKFLATDTGIVSEGDGSNWNAKLAQFRYAAPSSSGAAGNLVAGHASNSVGSGVSGATIAGGGSSSTPNSASGNYATIGGGRNNTASDQDATVGGGRNNTASLPSATVAGGSSNEAKDANGTVGGGNGNVVTGASGTIAGGISNRVNVAMATVGGGRNNTASGANATVPGGEDNEASGQHAVVAGGQSNEASGDHSIVVGGDGSSATAPNAFAGGTNASASHEGAFVWCDTSSGGIASVKSDEFVVSAQGGVYLFSNAAATTGVELAPGSGSWSSASSRKIKSNVEPVDGPDVLERVCDLEISTWNYDAEGEEVRHMGPMAEDFSEAFGLGSEEGKINTVDADGVALAAIQGLSERLGEKEATIERQEARIDDLEAENDALSERLAAVEAELGLDGATDRPAAADD